MNDQSTQPARSHIAIIILTMNQKAKTLRCIESFTHVGAPSFEILLFDNGSQDGTVAAVAEKFPHVHLHHAPENLGVAGGRNTAAQLAIDLIDPTHLFFIDNDMTVEPDFLEKLLAPMVQDQKIAQTTGKIKDMEFPDRIYGAGGCGIVFWRGDTNHIGYGEQDHGQYNRPHACIVSGGCMLVRVDLFQQLGGFDMLFNPYGPEDLDLGLRLKAAGYTGWYVPDAVVYHESHPGRTIDDGGGYSQSYAANRSKQWLRFMRRHASWYQKMSFYLIGAPYLLSGIIIRETKRGNLLPALRGLLGGALSQD